jgi:hypothetical protein
MDTSFEMIGERTGRVFGSWKKKGRFSFYLKYPPYFKCPSMHFARLRTLERERIQKNESLV